MAHLRCSFASLYIIAAPTVSLELEYVHAFSAETFAGAIPVTGGVAWNDTLDAAAAPAKGGLPSP